MVPQNLLLEKEMPYSLGKWFVWMDGELADRMHPEGDGK